ncbi:WRKY Transcription Factor [Stylosanthes scabra]|uniref:WRKY Transcription Factor n=1 Tax=Stylosanthes scabra TaxID=79078 RepID=A0ABU6UF25_9FABA|nr:WRKY Transcription Factor [Stylosanthes scabra]
MMSTTTTTSQTMVINNQQSLFGDQDDHHQNMEASEMGFLPLLPTTMIFPTSPPLGCNNHHPQQQQQPFYSLLKPFSSILSPNSIASDQADSTSNLTAETLLATTDAHQKSTLDLTSTPFLGPQFLSLNRSTAINNNPWATGEVPDCFSSKRNVIDNHHYHHHNHHVGVSTIKMKKMKGRRKVREPRFCFKTLSDVDVLDDGYKWRKYGQKVVKNTQHPRSYYRCTQDNCRVKKRVERLAEDPRMVITTYEGRHAHIPSNDLEDSQSPSQLTNFFW